MLKRLFAPWDLPAKGNPAFERIAYVYVIPIAALLSVLALTWPSVPGFVIPVVVGAMLYCAVKTRTWG